MEITVLALLEPGPSFANVGWWLILFIVAFLIAMEVKRQQSAEKSPGGFRKANERRAEKTLTTRAPEDVTKDYMEVVLERDSVREPWGLVWHVQGYKAQRFLIAGLEPNSPAGSCRAQGLRGIRRGDELLSVNGKCQFQLMCQELARAEKLSLQFLKADVVLPLDESSDEDLCQPEPRSPSIQASAESDGQAIAESVEEEDEPSCGVSQPFSPSEVASLAASSGTTGATCAEPRGRDAAIKRADAPVKKKSRRHGAGHFSSSASGSGSGSEQASCASKCPSTDWEYMMDNRPGSLMTAELQGLSARDRPVPAAEMSHTNNVVIVAGSPVIALQTASALGTVVGGGVFHPMQNIRGRQQLPVLPSSQLAAAPMIHTDAMGQICPVVEQFVPQMAEVSPELQAVQAVPFPMSRQGSKESAGTGSATCGVIFEAEESLHARSGSAPPGGCCMELPTPPQAARKRTYRSGKKVRAKRTRAAIRAMQAAEAAEVAEAPAEVAPQKQPEAEVKGSAARSGSAPPSCHGGALKNPEPEEGKLYYKPRRRAGKKVRQRMEHAIARRREQALMAEAAENCRMVSDDEGAHAAPKRLARAARAKRADSPVSTVSTAISTAAATVSAVASTATASNTGSEGIMPRRSFYSRRPPLSGLPTMAEAAPEIVPPRASQRNSSRDARRNSASNAGGDVEEIIGRQVLLTGLVHAPQFNGHWGHVDGFDATSQRYVLRVFTGQPGAKPKIAKLRRDCFIVPKGEVPSEAGQPKAWQPSLRLGA